ncbi:unnamed protein product [Sphacelaria rigidula]
MIFNQRIGFCFLRFPCPCNRCSPRQDVTRWINHSRLHRRKNVRRTVWNLLSNAMDAIVDTLCSTFFYNVMCCHHPGCARYRHHFLSSAVENTERLYPAPCTLSRLLRQTSARRAGNGLKTLRTSRTSADSTGWHKTTSTHTETSAWT